MTKGLCSTDRAINLVIKVEMMCRTHGLELMLKQSASSHIADRQRRLECGTRMEDLNYLLRRQQQERSLAMAAASAKARKAHARLAQLYQKRILRMTMRRLSFPPLCMKVK